MVPGAASSGGLLKVTRSLKVAKPAEIAQREGGRVDNQTAPPVLSTRKQATGITDDLSDLRPMGVWSVRDSPIKWPRGSAGATRLQRQIRQGAGRCAGEVSPSPARSIRNNQNMLAPGPPEGTLKHGECSHSSLYCPEKSFLC